MKKRGKIHRYAKKMDLMNININYGGKKIAFNLFDELRIDEDAISRELQQQPTHFAFVSMLQKKCQTRFEQLRQERKKLFGELYLHAKKKTHQNRPYSDDMCRAYVESHRRYRKITTECIKAKDDADILYSCVSGFLQKKDLLQTISSNNRKTV